MYSYGFKITVVRLLVFHLYHLTILLQHNLLVKSPRAFIVMLNHSNSFTTKQQFACGCVSLPGKSVTVFFRIRHVSATCSFGASPGPEGVKTGYTSQDLARSLSCQVEDFRKALCKRDLGWDRFFAFCCMVLRNFQAMFSEESTGL